MALNDLSAEYRHSALLIKNRLVTLRRELKATTDPEVAWGLKRRIAELTPMLTEMNELAELTARYYEPDYYRNAKYSANCFDESDRSTSQTNAVHIADTINSEDGKPAGYAPSARPAVKAARKKPQTNKSRSLLDVLGNGKK